MSIDINSSGGNEIRELYINNIEVHRAEVNNNFVYGKRPVNFDTNLGTVTLPSGSATSYPPDEGDYYFFWNDFVYTLRESDWTKHINEDNTTWIGTPSIDFTVQPSDGYDISISFLGWYTESEGGIQITNDSGGVTSSGNNFIDNSNNYPSSNSTGMSILTLYAHWDVEIKIRITISGPSDASFNYNGNSYSSCDVWVDYNSGVFNLLNDVSGQKWISECCTDYVPSSSQSSSGWKPSRDGHGFAGWGWSLHPSTLISGTPRFTEPTTVYACYRPMAAWIDFSKSDTYSWQIYGSVVPVSPSTLYNDSPSWAKEYWKSSDNYSTLYYNDWAARYVSAD